MNQYNSSTNPTGNTQQNQQQQAQHQGTPHQPDGALQVFDIGFIAETQFGPHIHTDNIGQRQPQSHTQRAGTT
jgi:hypothetical protein